MSFRGDDRGAAIQVGAVILFGFLVLSMAAWQAQVVPSENANVEFTHNQRAVDDMQDVRNAVVGAPGGGAVRSVAVELAPEYPPRALFVNPGRPTGTVRTVGTTDPGLSLVVDNAAAVSGATADFWDGSARSYNTGGLLYRPDYNVYTGAPTTVYENSVLYNRHDGGPNLTVVGQDLVDGTAIELVALNGSLARTGSGSLTLDPDVESASTTEVALTDSGGNVTISFPSQLNASWWTSALEDELVDNGGHVVDVSQAALPGPFFNVTVELEAGVTYRLRMAKIGVGSGVTPTSETYLESVQGDGESVALGGSQRLVVEVRDRYNNPVAGVTVTGSAGEGSLADRTVTTGSDGRAAFTYNAPNSGGSRQVDIDFSFTVDPATDPYDDAAPENETLAVDVRAGASGGAYSANWQDPDDTNPSGSLSSCTNDECTWNITQDSDDRLTLQMATSPSLSGIGVEFSKNNSLVALNQSSTTTDGDGEAFLELSNPSTGSVTVYVVTGDSSDAITIHIEGGGTPPNSPPTASFTHSCTGLTCQFDASGSSDPDGSVTTYRWDWNDDGTVDDTTSSATISHTFGQAGTHSVSLEVEDDGGATDSVTDQVSTGGGLSYNSDGTALQGSGGAGTSSVVEFSVTSNRNDDVEIVAVKINNTSNNQASQITDGGDASEHELAVDVGGDGALEDFVDPNGQALPANFSLTGDGDTATFTSGSVTDFRLYEFAKNNGQAVGMSGESITVTIYYRVDGVTYAYTFDATNL